MSQQKIAQSDSGALSGASEASPAVGGGVLAARLAQGCGREAAKDGGGGKNKTSADFQSRKRVTLRGFAETQIASN